MGKLKGLWLAIRADTLSIVAFELGLLGWMILSAKVIGSRRCTSTRRRTGG